MNAFIIHSSKDAEAVRNNINIIQNSIETFSPLILDNGGALWKLSARDKIKKSNLILFFVGKESHKSPYIGWEIMTSIKYNKQIIVVKLDHTYRYHEALEYKDDFTKITKIYGKEKSIDELIKYLHSHERGDYNLFNPQFENAENMSILFEQYKLFLQTSETLVQRRQNVNNFYITANTILVSLCGTVVAINIILKFKIMIIIAFAIVGIGLSLSWINMLISYGNLNSSKMKIISVLEKNLPASLFDAEWEVLTDKLNNKRYISFTDSEKKIPQLFLVLYTVIIIIASVSVKYIL